MKVGVEEGEGEGGWEVSQREAGERREPPAEVVGELARPPVLRRRAGEAKGGL